MGKTYWDKEDIMNTVNKAFVTESLEMMESHGKDEKETVAAIDGMLCLVMEIEEMIKKQSEGN